MTSKLAAIKDGYFYPLGRDLNPEYWEVSDAPTLTDDLRKMEIFVGKHGYGYAGNTLFLNIAVFYGGDCVSIADLGSLIASAYIFRGEIGHPDDEKDSLEALKNLRYQLNKIIVKQANRVAEALAKFRKCEE
jgi:hypothetical protein